MEQGLRHAVLEQGDIGGTILQYPRRKVVLTSPVELPVWGRLKFTEISKEKLLGVWEEVVRETGLAVRTQEKMLELQRFNGLFRVVSSKDEYVARHVILALGRRGTPRKLGVPGEALPKVMYRLHDAESYQNLNLLVVGGGDSAVEAAIALAMQKTNRVTLSYRQREFGRVKARNLEHLSEQVRKNGIRLALGTTVQEIRSDLVLLSTPDGLRQLPNDYVVVSVAVKRPSIN
jgi:thioredoxin reductase